MVRLLFFLVSVALAASALAEDRIALVIGNDGYPDGSRLQNPVHDAELIKTKLEEVGFNVEVEPNATKARMQAAIDRFKQRIARANAGATALFYYAGHGFAWDGVNYLIPVDAKIDAGADLWHEAVSIDWILNQMQRGGGATKIMILDACRNTPLVERIKVPGQFVQGVRAPPGTFIAFSTGLGAFARDGSGLDSPYAEALAAQLPVGEQLITDLFTNVGIEVEAVTGGSDLEPQVPWISTSLRTKFKFVGSGVPEFVSSPSTYGFPRPLGVLAVDFARAPAPFTGNGIIAAASFLEEGPLPLKITNVAPKGATVQFERNNPGLYGGKAVIAEISPNMLTMHGVNGGSGSFTLTLAKPARSLSFKIPKLYSETSSGITFPAWKAVALSSSGEILAADARALGRSFTTIPSEIVTLRAPGSEPITQVRFDSDYRLNGRPFAAFEAILIEGIWVDPMERVNWH